MHDPYNLCTRPFLPRNESSNNNKKLPKEKVPCKCLSIIMLDSVIESDEKYYPQTFLEECKYVQEKIKVETYIDEKLDSDSDDDE